MWTVWLLVILKHNQQDIFTAISCSYSNTFSLFFLYSSSSILLLPRHVVQLWVVCCTFDTSDTEGGSPSLRTSSSHLYKKNEHCVSERQGGISEGDLIFSILFFFFYPIPSFYCICSCACQRSWVHTKRSSSLPQKTLLLKRLLSSPDL